MTERVLVLPRDRVPGGCDFTGVRGTAALAKLPDDERQEWQKLWDDVAGLLNKSHGKEPPGKK